MSPPDEGGQPQHESIVLEHRGKTKVLHRAGFESDKKWFARVEKKREEFINQVNKRLGN